MKIKKAQTAQQLDGAKRTKQTTSSPYQLTPEENQILMNVRQKILSGAPEIGDIMQNQRSKAILFNILEALGNISAGQLKSIISKVQQSQVQPQEAQVQPQAQQTQQAQPTPRVVQQPDQGVVQQESQTMVPTSG